MKLSDDGVKLIKSFESYMEKLPDGRCRAYRCVVGRDKKGRPIYDGKWTIGWGCTEGVAEGLVWTRAEAETAFREELSRFGAAVNRLIKVPITQHQHDSLVSFAYNVGEGKDGLGGSTLLKKLNKGDVEGAAREFGKWVNSNGVKNVPGLVRRRAEEKAMFLRPVSPSSDIKADNAASSVPVMPQTVDVPAPVATAIQSSRTVFGTLIAGIGAILAAGKELITEAVSQIVSLAPARELLAGFGLNATRIALIVTVAGLAYALYARLNDAHNGANSK